MISHNNHSSGGLVRPVQRVAIAFCGLLFLWSCAHSSTARGSGSSAPHYYHGDVSTLFSCVVQAVTASEWQIQFADEGTGVVSASTPTSLLTWGDNVSVTVTVVDTFVYRVDISSSSEQLVDWGRNSGNISTFYRHLDRLVVQYDLVRRTYHTPAPDTQTNGDGPASPGSEQISF